MMMELLGRVVSGLGLFVGSLAAGVWCGRKGWLPEARAGTLIRWLVQRLSPVVLCLSFWGLKHLTLQLLILPVIGLAASMASLLPAWGYAKASGMSRPQTGAFLACAPFSNLAFFGALIAFALYGEGGYSLAIIHMLYFSPAFYAVGFTIAKRYGQPRAGVAAPAFSEELRIYPLAGLVAGCALNLLRVPRPDVLGALNRVLIPVDAALYILAIGSQIRWEPESPWVRPSLAMSAIKFFYTPLVAWGLVSAFGLTGLPKFVVLLQSSMPVGVSPLMLPLVYQVDRRLSHTLWVVTTCLAVPWLLVYLPLINR